MQQQSQVRKLKAVKHALSILRAEQIPISESYLKTYYRMNNINLVTGPVLQKRMETYHGNNGTNK